MICFFKMSQAVRYHHLLQYCYHQYWKGLINYYCFYALSSLSINWPTSVFFSEKKKKLRSRDSNPGSSSTMPFPLV